MSRKEFKELEDFDLIFHLDEIQAKIYGFLENNSNKAFTLFEIYVDVFVEDWMRDEIRKTCTGEEYISIRHNLYTAVLKGAEKMVKEDLIAGRYHKGKYYYAV